MVDKDHFWVAVLAIVAGVVLALFAPDSRDLAGAIITYPLAYWFGRKSNGNGNGNGH